MQAHLALYGIKKSSEMKKKEGVNRQSRQEQLYNKNLSLLRRILTDSITESHVVVQELSWRMLDRICLQLKKVLHVIP